VFYFRKIIDEKEFELSNYVLKYLDNCSNKSIKIHVGCDSQNIGKSTLYATTVVFHIGNSGCHFVYKKEKVPKIEDMWTKLWGETTRSVDIANYLKDKGVKIHSVDLDFNSDDSHKSNKLVSASVGFVESMGFKANVKPSILPAISAADMMC
tara:strand:+ start:293 stop:748 length:456 start_codon:yes stop_codon:yes gene_type:complete